MKTRMKRFGERLKKFLFPGPNAPLKLLILPYATLGVLALVFLTGGIASWEYSNSPEFCGAACHTMPPQDVVYKESPHANVTCEECHIGRASFFNQLTRKSQGLHELYYMTFNLYEYPIRARALRPARDTCEKCHQPETFSDDSLRIKTRFENDVNNTQKDIYLILKTGGGAKREGLGRGIHWHIDQNVEYVTDDVQKRTIPWVRITDKDGKVTEYLDASSKLSKAEIDRMQKRKMECVDCHNASGHPFKNPADRVDEAMADGRIDRSIPSIKARALAIIDKAATLHGPMEDQIGKFKQIIADAAPKGEQKPEQKAAEEKFAKAMLDILQLSEFEAKDLTWKSFPNHVGHKDFPGCFRCHDGKHVNAKGEAIRLQCTLCHDIPQVTVDGTLKTVASTKTPGLTPPDSHNAPNFMHDHRSKVDDTCQMCHGPLKWGKDGGNFCANPACHGRKWPEMSLDAKKT